jgi:hypothetical protein
MTHGHPSSIIQQEVDEQFELDEMEAALTARRFYEDVVQSSRPHGINDNRLQAIELSLGSWMLIFAGIVDSLLGKPERFSPSGDTDGDSDALKLSKC